MAHHQLSGRGERGDGCKTGCVGLFTTNRYKTPSLHRKCCRPCINHGGLEAWWECSFHGVPCASPLSGSYSPDCNQPFQFAQLTNLPRVALELRKEMFTHTWHLLRLCLQWWIGVVLQFEAIVSYLLWLLLTASTLTLCWQVWLWQDEEILIVWRTAKKLVVMNKAFFMDVTRMLVFI